MKFSAKVLTAQGKIERISEDHPDGKTFERLLKERGLSIISLRKSSFLPEISGLPFVSGKKVPKDVFLSEITVLLRSGIPLQEAVAILEKCEEGSQGIYGRIQAHLREGKRFSQAVEGLQILSPTELSLLRSGEETGEFRPMLEVLLEHVKGDLALQRRMVALVAYPSFLLLFATAVLGYVVFGVLPKLAESMSEMAEKLPPLTKFLMGSLGAVREFWWVVALASGALTYIGYIFYRSRKESIFKTALRLPLLGEILRMRLQASFLPPLLVLLKKKIPLKQIVEPLKISYTGVPLIEELLQKMDENKGSGKGLSDMLCDSDLFSPKEKELLRVGERASRIQEMLKEILASNLEKYEARVKTVVSLMEPALIVGVGLIVLAFVLLVVLPIISFQGEF
ncbi:MAG: type II secretion system F family protein [Spirochaetes bacterium]|nr:type II secretion system F family protein [Spirochaetota bacterium]